MQRDLRRLWQCPGFRAGIMAFLGGANVILSTYYQPIIYRAGAIEAADTSALTWHAATVSEISRQAAATVSELLPAESGYQPVLDAFNLVHYFPEGADEADPTQSLGNQVFGELTDWDSDWAGAVYGYAGLTPEEMTEKMGISQACIMGDYNPEDSTQQMDDPSTWTIGKFRNVWFLVEDGDGNPVSVYSNVQEIMAMASVYTYYHDPEDADAFFDYCKALWKASHYYTLTISDVYHCGGCVRADGSGAAAEEASQSLEAAETDAPAYEDNAAVRYSIDIYGDAALSSAETPALLQSLPDAAESTDSAAAESTPAAAAAMSAAAQSSAILQLEAPSETASESSAVDGSGDIPAAVTASDTDMEVSDDAERICPGHVDLTIVLRIAGMNEEKGLFARDPMGNLERSSDPNGWQGWTEENRAAALALAAKDWSAAYGLRAASYTTQFPLQTADVDAYLLSLPANLSEKRKNLLRFALGSVGRVPYYWGGKASSMGYDGNNFGTSVTPDSEGRNQKGLDCSGWISWVYWSATGTHLAAESTTGLSGLGTRIRPEELKPGDILVRTGANAHTVMFLGWTEDGRIVCVHETSGSVNNVTISVRDADWPYYIRLID